MVSRPHTRTRTRRGLIPIDTGVPWGGRLEGENEKRGEAMTRRGDDKAMTTTIL